MGKKYYQELINQILEESQRIKEKEEEFIQWNINIIIL